MPTAIEFENVGKQYRLGLVSTQTLSHDLHRWWTVNVRGKEDPYLKIGDTNDRSVKGSSDYVWALKDISFKVEQGDVVGIIGRNGAGKSTLLKLLSKVTGPTTGQIRARGRIGSLLEVGTGFHPEMTGRENIFMNGAILGMSKAEIASKLDEIVDFSGCERYLDTPVKRYSSGMMVRLGFAVAAHLDPEILVVDEVLAVGDAEFQKKAIGKMKDVSQGQGRTVLFVSHNMASMRALCHTGIMLENGTIKESGLINNVISKYLSANEACITIPVKDMPRSSSVSNSIRYTDIQFLDFSNNEIAPRTGHPLRIRLFFDSKGQSHDKCTFTITISDSFENPILIYPSALSTLPFKIGPSTQHIDCDIPKLPLTGGTYKISLWGAISGYGFDHIANTIKLDVIDDDYFEYGREISANYKGKVMYNEHTWHLD